MNISRREFVTRGSLSMLLTSALKATAGNCSFRPNVLIIHTDEHNFRTLGCYRKALSSNQALVWGADAVVETPWIDSLAQNGVIADSFYCASPVCSPSRATFVSGLYPMDTDVICNDIPLNPDVETFADVLHEHGYTTGYAGKWHLAGEPRPGWEPECNAGFKDNRYMFNRGHWKKLEFAPDGGPQVGMVNGNPSYWPIGDEATFTTDWLTSRTLDFISEHCNVPFCFMVSIPDPHGPDTVREPYASRYADIKFSTPRTASKDPASAPAWGEMPPKMPEFDDTAYFGMVKCIDDNVGRILNELKILGLADKTIVVFTSDHGDMRGEHGLQDKGVPYEASARIPFIISAPGLLPAGMRTSAVMNTVDFKPTLLSLMGISPRKASQGRDMSVALRGRTDGIAGDLIFCRSPGVWDHNGWLMTTDGRYKLIASPVDPLWLFDLESDPNELINRADDLVLKAVKARMAKALLNYARMYNDPNLSLGKMREFLETAASGSM